MYRKNTIVLFDEINPFPTLDKISITFRVHIEYDSRTDWTWDQLEMVDQQGKWVRISPAHKLWDILHTYALHEGHGDIEDQIAREIAEEIPDGIGAFKHARDYAEAG